MAVPNAVTSLMVTWAAGESSGSDWTRECLEKLELAAETIRVIFLILGDDVTLGTSAPMGGLERLPRVNPSTVEHQFEQDTLNELRMMVSDDDPAFVFLGPPLDLLNRLANVLAPPAVTGP